MITADIRKAKIDFESKIADKIKEDPKSFYAYVRSKSKTKTTIGPLLNADGNIVMDNKGMVSILNDYFSSVFTKEDLENIPEARNIILDGKNCSLEDIEINTSNIFKAINSLKANKAAGVDGIHSSFIKGCANGVGTPLELIF